MRIAVLYGSQTGCAHEVAENISLELLRRKIPFLLSELDAYDCNALAKEEFVIFILSTTGQGEEPQNMKIFWKLLRQRSLSSQTLSRLQFALFGLGDSSYEKFNFAAKKLFRRLIQLGATPLIERGDGDEQHVFGVQGALQPWLECLWKALSILVDTDVLIAGLLPPKVDFELARDSGEYHSSLARTRENKAIVLENKRITCDNHFQDIRHLAFKGDFKFNNFFNSLDLKLEMLRSYLLLTPQKR
jgi:sulfite reductase alpha subunit-like flavoprotein